MKKPGFLHSKLGVKAQSKQYESGQLSSKNSAPKASKPAKGKGVFAY